MQKDERLFLEELVEKHGKGKDALVAILLGIQNKHGFLPQDQLQIIPTLTSISPASVKEVATYYPHFRLRPAGKHRIKVCIGTACYVKGAEQTYQAFKDYLKIPEDDDTDPDRLFTVSKVACLGCCMLAPAVQIDELIYGWVGTTEVAQVSENFLKVAAEKQNAEIKLKNAEHQGEVRICLCSSCAAAGANKIYSQLLQWSVKHGFLVKPTHTGCTGLSFEAPLIEIIEADKSMHYGKVDPESLAAILNHHFRPAGLESIVDKLLSLSLDPVEHLRVDTQCDQTRAWLDTSDRIVMAQGNRISPCDYNAYCNSGGFEGIKKAAAMTPESIIAAVAESGLRGRGGAGFPTARKWQLTACAQGEKKYLICNADEGDPGAFMDRMLLESVPFRIIEGMMIAAVAVGADQGFIFVRQEYPLAVKRIREALKICHEHNILGTDSRFLPGFDIKVVEGAGAFVCGEETALIAAIEGERGVPRERPPYPAEKGLYGCPTLINNVETFATVPWILIHGAEKFRKSGTSGSPGTKTFALAGKVKRGGLIEVPMGMTIRQIVNDIGGGIDGTGEFKAVQIGGPSGGCLPEAHFDLPIDFEALAESGAIMGSGGLVVLDEYDCMVDIARYFLEFTADESCGNCSFCRIGSTRLLEALERLCHGKAHLDDLETIENLAILIRKGSRCGLGKTAPNPVLTTLRYFRDEYEAHINGFCPAGKCPDLFTFVVNDKCNGCMICARQCPVEAIEFTPWEQAKIDAKTCVRCGVCRQACPQKAIIVEKNK